MSDQLQSAPIVTRALSPDQRSVCELLAVIGVPVPLSVLGDALSAAGVRARSGSLLNADRAKRIVEQLEAARALTRDGRDVALEANLLRACTDTLVEDGDFEARAAVLKKALGEPADNVRSARAHLRAALLLGRRREARRLRASLRSEESTFRLRSLFDLDGRSVDTLPADSRAWAVGVLLVEAFDDWRRDDDALEAGAELEDWDDVRLGLALHAWVEGRHETALRLAAPRTVDLMALRGSIQVHAGRDAALDNFDTAYSAAVREMSGGRAVLPDIHGLLHLALLIAAEREEDARGVFSVQAGSAFPEELGSMRACLGEDVPLSPLVTEPGWAALAGALVRVWRGDVWETDLEPTLRRCEERATEARWLGVAAECAAARAIIRDAEHDEAVGRWASILRPPASWRTSLAELGALAVSLETETVEERVVYELRTEREAPGFSLRPRLQTRSRDGAWTRGRAMASDRLADKAGPEDRAIVDHIALGDQDAAKFDPAVLDVLIGHPRVVSRDDPSRPMPVRRGRIALRIRRTDEGLSLTLEPTEPGVQDEGDHFVVTTFDAAHARLASLASRMRSVPEEAERDLVDTAVNLVGAVDLRADTALPGEVDGDPAPRVRLRRCKTGVAWEMVVSPFGPGGPVADPGEGSTSWMIAEPSGPRAVRRALDQETALAAALLDQCLSMKGDARGQTENLEQALELLAQLTEAGVAVDWRQDRPLRVAGEVGVLGVRASIAMGAGGWLEIKGEVQVDEDHVVALGELLEAARDGRGYITLDDGRLVRLSDQLREELTRIEAHRVEGKLHPSLLLSLERSVLEPELLGRAAERRERMLHVMNTRPTLPEELTAELRTYQDEGFVWLHRLTELGFGACLADDMGLGKTVQTLALLLARASSGPALVVAPTSVVSGWAEQSKKFAGTLKVRRLEAGSSTEERRKWVTEAGPGDVVLTTHGLLPRERELLASREWSTVVLDEAQAFKNPRTARARAAFALRGASRVALSGTPIENRTGELWSLFRFLQPGLLGSLKHFREELATPIEQDRDPLALERLRHRVSPFLLRRTKSEVLTELPPRTDVVLRVEPGESQRDLIEAVRREGLATAMKEGSRIQVLAALTKLRQACCHPRLIMPESDVPSAKLETFIELVHDLREGGHRALVFSQFVRHLDLVREVLDRDGVSYQYLDGSTPAKAREERIAKFQGGEGELFLISLKAGGTGVHLTAADYVVHLDPWWNPAVEDQASDRAHRIGQTRPVTVYRLVVADSVEEKILELHERKRDLADQLLASAGASADLETLLGLLRD